MTFYLLVCFFFAKKSISSIANPKHSKIMKQVQKNRLA